METLPKGLHLRTPAGLIIYLTDNNETVVKLFLHESYSSDAEVYIYETDETIKIEDVFET